MRTGKEPYRDRTNYGNEGAFTYVDSLVELARQMKKGRLVLKEANRIARDNWNKWNE